MKNRKFMLTIIGVLIGILTVIGIGYAYYMAYVGSGASTNVNVTSDTTDKFTFTQGDAIALNATQFNFTSGGSDLSSTTTSSATLVANSTNSSASNTYQAYFKINSNTYTYTKDTSTPEIILTITDPTGAAVTSISGLTYVTISDTLKGFDITNKTGLYAIASDYAISTTSSTTGTTQNWTVAVTYRNLSSDQSNNAGCSLNANLLLQKDKITLASIILKNNGGITAITAKTTPTFSSVSTTNDGMYAATDDYGTSYYFRGAVNNNWVKFANMYWRIIRINGDGTIRMIYTGTTAPTEAQATVMTGTGTQINATTYAFNSSYNDNMYVGYMYTSGSVHGYGTSSTIKTVIDTWYTSNLASYASKLADSVYCNDRSNYTDTAGTTSGGGTGTTTTYYGSYIRLITNKLPILTCSNKTDAFTVSDTTHGNAHLTYPIGLITVDEIAMAGGVWGTNNSSYYLYTNQDYWSGSPNFFNSSHANGFNVNSSGNLNYFSVNVTFGARPVVFLTSDISGTGSGTWNDPYVVN